jgi:hypothetical protein
MFISIRSGVIIFAATLSGCGSTIASYTTRPVQVHTLRENRFFSLTGERRLAFQVARNDRRVAWCAESLPEAAQAVAASSALQVPNRLQLDDQVSTSLTQTFTRTEIAELYRQMAWQACQAWAQGVYTDDQYREQLNLILAGGIRVIEARAQQPLAGTPPSAAAVVQNRNATTTTAPTPPVHPPPPQQRNPQTRGSTPQ